MRIGWRSKSEKAQLGAWALAALASLSAASGSTFRVTYPSEVARGPLDGRLLVLLSTDGRIEPRFLVREEATESAQVFGVDANGWMDGAPIVVADRADGYPTARLSEIPAGDYFVQAVLHLYSRVTPKHGHSIRVPWDRGEGQRWFVAPGNLYMAPKKVHLDPKSTEAIPIELEGRMQGPEPLADTDYVRHVRIRSKLLSEFWGRDVDLGANVLVPFGFDDHPRARYPVVVSHGHFPDDFDGFRITPPDPNAPCIGSERFGVDCYNRIVDQEAYAFFQKWTAPEFPRFLIVEIQHANPFYDDSYAVNSANLGPYGDAIVHELLPAIEQRFRGIGQGWARFAYGGSTGGWEALAAQIFYPDEFNGAFAACPDPVDFRGFFLTNLYADANAYFRRGRFGELPVPEERDRLGGVLATMESANRMERALGSHGRSGGDFDAYSAVYSPVGDDGYPKPIFDKATGAIDPAVAAYWKEHFDLRAILERDWKTLAPRLRGKLHVYVGTADSYFLNGAVEYLDDFLKKADPPAEAEVKFGQGFEHCWNGDAVTPNYLSRLRYHTMYVPQILARIAKTAPKGADTTSWRY